MKISREAQELSKALLPNLRALASQIARKPPTHDARWARTISEAFTLYTRTSTVNLLVAFSDGVRENGWPFPTFLDLKAELHRLDSDMSWFRWGPLWNLLAWRSLTVAMFRISSSGLECEVKLQWVDALMCRRFNRASKNVFGFWLAHPLLQTRRALLVDLIAAYRRKLWRVCVPATLPLLDYLMRKYLGSANLRTSVATIADSFKAAGITYEALKPGFGVWDASKPDSGVTPVAESVERDLRLPGIYLASFVEWAQKFYAWHTIAGTEPAHTINRHAVLHGDSTGWSKADAVKLFVFFDLALKLEPVLRIVLRQPAESAG